jgi:hypothetical protein
MREAEGWRALWESRSVVCSVEKEKGRREWLAKGRFFRRRVGRDTGLITETGPLLYRRCLRVHIGWVIIAAAYRLFLVMNSTGLWREVDCRHCGSSKTRVPRLGVHGG